MRQKKRGQIFAFFSPHTEEPQREKKDYITLKKYYIVPGPIIDVFGANDHLCSRSNRYPRYTIPLSTVSHLDLKTG